MTTLYILNRYLLQFLFIRLARVGYGRGEYFVQTRWALLCWVVPFTGWKNDFLYLGKPNAIEMDTDTVIVLGCLSLSILLNITSILIRLFL